MDKLEVLEYITNHNKEFAGRLVTESGFKKHFPELYEEMSKMEYPDFFSEFDFKQKLWHFLRDDYTLHYCKCGGLLKFRSFWYGYNEFCRMNCPAMIENQKKCVAEKNETRSDEEKKQILDKTKKTFLKKYGVERYSQTNEWKEKTLQKNREKFGADWYSQTEKYKKEYEECCMKKYGVKNAFQVEDVKKKIHNKFYDSFKSRHKNVIEIKKDTLLCKCTDETCTLCEKKVYEIKKTTFSDRICHNIDTCTIRTPYGDICSGSETLLSEYIKSIYSGCIIKNDRSVLSGKELDIYLPELNIAFEFNGIYWHNEFNKPRYYHQDKSLECKENGIQLIHIWEDDWLYRNDIVKDIIKSKLGLSDFNIGARKCEIRNVSNKDAIDFLNKYHIQGGVSNGKSIGLYYQNNLVEILTFGQLRKNMGSTPEDGKYEIYRVCSKAGYNIQGGFSRLLHFFETEYKPKEVITYGNLDYTYGNVYLKCGFIECGLSAPTYTWVVDGKRCHRSNFMKSKLDECKSNPELTESDVMHSRGHWRCWDAGKIKFIKTYERG